MSAHPCQKRYPDECVSARSGWIPAERQRSMAALAVFKTRQSTFLTCANAVEGGSSGTYSA